MKKQTRMRLGLMPLVLALAVAITGYADRDAEAYCLPRGCEVCMLQEEYCPLGIAYPECGGNPACCLEKVYTNCYDCCYWI